MSSFIKFILLSLCGLLITHQVFAAWSSDWDTQQKISINTSGLQSTINNVPVLVRLHSGNFDFTGAKLDGADLRFIAADDKTELKFYLEKYDATNELAVAWVVLPQLSAANKDVYITLYSGNENASAASDPAVLNDATLQARFAFLETSLLKDSSHQLTASGTFTAVKAGLIAGSAAFTDSPLTFSVTQAPDATQGLTWSVWLKPVTLPQTGTIFQSGNVSLVLNGSTLNLQAGNTKAEGGTLKASDWHHIAIVLESGKGVVYVNGSPVIQTPVTDVKVDANLSVGQGLQAEIDELQWAAEARSADWLRFASQTQGMDAKLVTVAAAGEDSEGEEGDVNYISILVNSLTVDAKVVIAILAVMFAISAWVMVSKGMLVTRTDKDNRLFLQRFQQSNENDLLTLDQSGTYLHSTLFGLYQAGLREIKKREHAGIVQLSGASIDAIKAAVDADLVRETQRMNGMMVLLTIAISGGPFLGLLGTVVGVMITFAAIAAAGDVNVNAIAPGIAAALLATVAGLGVAIPALFGYNYLASRIKNITIAMQIFVDEFITRTAELYGKE